MRVLVTGGAGFIGSALIREFINETQHEIVNVDALTYAGNLESLTEIEKNSRYFFEHADICDKKSLERIIKQYIPDAIIHLAAESHVDRSIDGPSDFIQTNIVGTYNLLEVARDYWQQLSEGHKSKFRFHHVSTDEVYGDLSDGNVFTEESAYDPSSPYAASKASSDHLVRAWHRTYGLPVVITNCSNNYGPYQFPEKLIPLIILNALDGQRLPVYGKGDQVRDWLYVGDHAKALIKVLAQGEAGQTYNIGGHNEMTNLNVVKAVCTVLDELVPNDTIGSYVSLIEHVKDRPGHDQRYAIDASKIKHQLGWVPEESFDSGIKKTVQWYIDNRLWCENVLKNNYHRERLGIIK